jgi:hypothetical protein
VFAVGWQLCDSKGCFEISEIRSFVALRVYAFTAAKVESLAVRWQDCRRQLKVLREVY